ncbi:TPA: HEPN domain-containing protein [Aeromonas salmonicida subsp. salmonicida]|nr:HEPN domain-containing protein [Aeromonas salmonicida]ELI6420477.1 hypothetical protein [Aeromonas salmonicida subsp. salmonicida]ELM3648928.1 hypothetical protein [Aeromonas salmonicida subsp. salmonicida]QHE42409.1 hypothetical protein GO992_02530 [Aeromonas salmonicida subsp. salmonicida]QHE47800.1 hypothetical protein GO994_11340 [Aeromonas salmonicida subsp. salmonicida]QJF55471.1 hypothetical protein GO993_06845 [Aeromonas salmonicida subsp. salmonicida]
MSSIEIDGRYVFMDEIADMDRNDQLDRMDVWLNENYTYVESTSPLMSLMNSEKISLFDVLKDAFHPWIHEDVIRELAEELEYHNSGIWVSFGDPFEPWDMKVPKNPYEQFIESMDRIDELVESQQTFRSHSIQQHFRGLIHSSVYTTLETFTVEIFLKRVFSSDSVMGRYLAKQKHYAPPKFDIHDLLNGDGHIVCCIDGVKRDLMSSILKLSWHKIEEVFNRFMMVDIKFEFDLSKMDSIAGTRHDIVHRNGVNGEGIPTYISGDELGETRQVIRDFAAHVVELIRVQEAKEARDECDRFD